MLILIISSSVVIWQGNLPDVSRIDRRTWLFLILAGIITCVSSLLTFKALKIGDASRVSPQERVSLVFTIAFGAWFLKKRINWQIIAGAILDWRCSYCFFGAIGQVNFVTLLYQAKYAVFPAFQNL